MKVLSHIGKIDGIIFVTNVDGIFRADPDGGRGEMIRAVSPAKLLKDIYISTEDKVADVTGSMYGKAEKIADLALQAKVLVINGKMPGRLESAIKGEFVIGTLIQN